MAIVATEIESIHGSWQRYIYYRCQDSYGTWHRYGPVRTTDASFDADAYRATVAEKMADMLAEQELAEVLG